MKKIFLFFVVLIVLSLTLFMGCRPAFLKEHGTLQIILSESVSRILIPDTPLDIHYYQLILEGPNGENQRITLTERDYTSKFLYKGTWFITVDAYNIEDIKIGTGSDSVEIIPETVSTSNIVIAPLSGPGDFSVDVIWDNIYVPAAIIEYSLIYEDGTAYTDALITLNNENALLERPALPAGYYSFIVKLFDDTLLFRGAAELVRIAEGCITTGSFDFRGGGSQVGYVEINIIPDMNDPVDVILNGTVPLINPGESVTVTADTENLAGIYEWYLEGTQQVNDTNTFTISGLSVGMYRLDLIFYATDSRAGQTTWEFTVGNPGTDTPDSPEIVPGQWSVSEQEFSDGTVSQAYLYVTPDDEPMLMYHDDSHGKQIVCIWNGSVWVDIIGDPAFHSDYNQPKLIWDNGGELYKTGSAGNNFYFTRFNEETKRWETIFSRGGNYLHRYGGDLKDPRYPYLFRNHTDSYGRIGGPYNYGSESAQRYNGTTWENVGFFSRHHHAAHPIVLLDSNNLPYLAYFHENGNTAVSYYNYSTWESLGTIDSSVSHHKMYLDTQERPVFMYRKSNGTVYVKRWNGTIFDTIGDPTNDFGDRTYSYADFYQDSNNNLYFVGINTESNDRMTVWKYDGTAWSIVGDENFSDPGIRIPAICATSDSTIHVAYKDFSTSKITTLIFQE